MATTTKVSAGISAIFTSLLLLQNVKQSPVDVVFTSHVKTNGHVVIIVSLRAGPPVMDCHINVIFVTVDDDRAVKSPAMVPTP